MCQQGCDTGWRGHGCGATTVGRWHPTLLGTCGGKCGPREGGSWGVSIPPPRWWVEGCSWGGGGTWVINSQEAPLHHMHGWRNFRAPGNHWENKGGSWKLGWNALGMGGHREHLLI